MRTHFLILLSIIICGNVSGQRVTQIDSVAFYKQRPKVYYDANAEYQLSASMGDDHAYQDTIIIPTRDSLYKFISYTEDYNELFGLYREIPKYRNYRSIVYLSYNWLDTYYINLTNNRVFFFYGLTCRYGNKLLSVNRNSSDRRAYIGIYKINGDSIKELWSISPQNLDIYNIKEVYLRTKYVYICYEGLEAKYYVKIDTTFPLLSSGNIRETYVHPEAGYKECVQRTQYYPSGLPWAEATNASEQPWKYNGKEFVEMHGLDEYDSKARWYYPAVCRTTTMDPLAEKYYPTSPYAWCGNNPVRFVDLDGKDVWELNEQGSLVNMIADTTQDAIRMNGKQISFEYNSISSVSQDDYQTTFSFGNEDVAAGAFKFLADNSGVEYGLVNSAQKSTIVTQHLNSSVNVNGTIDAAISNKDFITSIIHNHPGNSGPSGFSNKQGDKQAIQNIENRLGYEIQAYVYQPDKQSLWFFTPSYRGNGGLGWNCFYPNQVGAQSHVIPSWMYSVKNFFGYKMKL